MADQIEARGRQVRTLAVWALRILVAGLFLLAATAKLAGQPMMVAEFGKIGLGQGFRVFTGLVEVLGALLVLWPRTTFWGALVLLAVCVGALIAQLGPLHGDLVHVLVFAALVAALALTHRSRPSATESR